MDEAYLCAGYLPVMAAVSGDGWCEDGLRLYCTSVVRYGSVLGVGGGTANARVSERLRPWHDSRRGYLSIWEGNRVVSPCITHAGECLSRECWAQENIVADGSGVLSILCSSVSSRWLQWQRRGGEMVALRVEA